MIPIGKHYFHDIDDEEEKFQKAYREYRKRKNLLFQHGRQGMANQYTYKAKRNTAYKTDWR